MKIIFLGMQGSGKSTQAQILAKKLNVPYIETGQLLRDKSNDVDNIGSAIRDALESGKLVENKITIDSLKEKIKAVGINGYVLDGYPRNSEQLSFLDNDIDKVFYINVSDEEATKRLQSRGRHDDTPELIKKRIEIFHRETEPLLDYFRKKGILVEINGERSVEAVSQDLEEHTKK